ncbi:sensor histidine kinase [Sphingomonas sp.]|jgi:two-component sensor histidine kinase|uniref:sensor histidine kinase n=1 Tax=Sphingomonas sp. TaxID=28214 RepID=UPI002EDB5B14
MRVSPPDDLYITEELSVRLDRPVDYQREAAALQELASRMAAAPEEVLPKFVELAMTLTGATSAGLSLYESQPAPGVFRWRHLTGMLAPFEDATTPRNHSPCGVTLDRCGTVLSKNPERFYEWIAAENLVIPEVLLVPLYIEPDEPAGTLWVVGEYNGQFTTEHSRVTRQLADFVGLAMRAQAKELRLRLALDEQETLAREMSHRLKNIFAMTEGMIRVTARTAESPAATAEALSGRIHALAEAHALVRRKASDIGVGPPLALADLILAVVRAHDVTELGEHRFVLDGPEISCGDHAINGIALLILELATNAIKYGALGTPAGRIAIGWRREGGRVILTWEESGGPAILAEPETGGFGTTLIKRTVAAQFAGKVEMHWAPSGLKIELDLSLARLSG